eukprot:581982-Rhodomonas_salina.1
MTNRYLLDDHRISLDLCLLRKSQRQSLSEYVEEFQHLNAALKLAQVSKADDNKVMAFCSGFREQKDRLFCLAKTPKNLKE